MASMKAKLGQPNKPSQPFVPGAPAQNRSPSAPANDAPKTPTK